MFKFPFEDIDDVYDKLFCQSKKEDWFFVDKVKPVFIYKPDSRFVIKCKDKRDENGEAIICRDYESASREVSISQDYLEKTITATYLKSSKYYPCFYELYFNDILLLSEDALDIDGKVSVNRSYFCNGKAKNLIYVINRPSVDFGVIHKID